jgi:hypothetical protein
VYGTGEEFDFPGKSLAELLDNSGIRSRGFSCNPFISDTFGFTRGFESMKRNWSSRRLDDEIFDWGEFESERQFESVLRFPEALYRVLFSDVETMASLKHGLLRKLYFDNSSLVAGDKGAQEVLRCLRQTSFDEGEFFFINLMEAHGPYKCPRSYQTISETNDGSSFGDILGFQTERPKETRQAYDDCVRYLSDIYNDIFDELRSDYDYIVTIADHGEQLGEDDNWGHNFGIHPTLTNIPFSIWANDGSHEDLDTDVTVSHVDVFATILRRAGVEVPSDRRGVDLFETIPTNPRLTEYHGISQPDKVERMRKAGYDSKTIETYDSWLRGITYPDGYYVYETVNDAQLEFRVVGDYDINAEEAREQLEREHDAIDIRPAENSIEYSGSLRDELEHLGYL